MQTTKSAVHGVVAADCGLMLCRHTSPGEPSHTSAPVWQMEPLCYVLAAFVFKFLISWSCPQPCGLLVSLTVQSVSHGEADHSSHSSHNISCSLADERLHLCCCDLLWALGVLHLRLQWNRELHCCLATTLATASCSSGGRKAGRKLPASTALL